MKTLSTALLSITTLALISGCSDDITFSSTVDGDKQLAEVTPEEATTLCEEIQATGLELAEATKEGACRFGAVFGAGFIDALGGADEAAMLCETAYDECVAQAPEVEAADCSDAVAPTDACMATVAEFTACYNDTAAEIQEFFGELASQSCSDLIDPTAIGGAVPSVTPPASCQTLAAKCAAFAAQLPGGTSTSTSS